MLRSEKLFLLFTVKLSEHVFPKFILRNGDHKVLSTVGRSISDQFRAWFACEKVKSPITAIAAVGAVRSFAYIFSHDSLQA